MLAEWRRHAKDTSDEALIFATRTGKPISPGNILKRWVFPACKSLGLPHTTWLTLRRTYASWSHDKGVPGKVMAELMGHAKVDTTLNVYTQSLANAHRAAVAKVGEELFSIVEPVADQPQGDEELTH